MTRRRRTALDDDLRHSLNWWSNRGVDTPLGLCADGWAAEFSRWDLADAELGCDQSRRLYAYLQGQGRFVCRREHDPRDLADQMDQGAELPAVPVATIVHEWPDTPALAPTTPIDTAAPPNGVEPEDSSAPEDMVEEEVVAPEDMVDEVSEASTPALPTIDDVLGPSPDGEPGIAGVVLPPEDDPAVADALDNEPEVAGVEMGATACSISPGRRCLILGEHFGSRFGDGSDLYTSVRDRRLAFAVQVSNAGDADQDRTMRVSTRDLPGLGYHLESPDGLPFIDVVGLVDLSLVDDPWLGELDQLVERLDEMATGSSTDEPRAKPAAPEPARQMTEPADVQSVVEAEPGERDPAEGGSTLDAVSVAPEPTPQVATVYPPGIAEALELLSSIGTELANSRKAAEDQAAAIVPALAPGIADPAAANAAPADPPVVAVASTAAAADKLPDTRPLAGPPAPAQTVDEPGETVDEPANGVVADQLQFFVDAAEEPAAFDVPVRSDGQILAPDSALRAHLPELVEAVTTPAQTVPDFPGEVQVDGIDLIDPAAVETAPKTKRRRGRVLISSGLVMVALALAGSWYFVQQIEPSSDATANTTANTSVNTGANTSVTATAEPADAEVILATRSETTDRAEPATAAESQAGESAPAESAPEISRIPSSRSELTSVAAGDQPIWDGAPVVTFTQCSDNRAVGYITNTFDEPATFDILIDFTTVPGAVLPASLTLVVDPGVTAELSAPFGAVLVPGIPIQCSGAVRAVDLG